MSNQNPTTAFPATQQDVTQLKQTATDAVNDLSSAVSVHASRVKSQLRDLAGHVQQESSDQLNQVKGRLSDLVDAAHGVASERPLVCVGAALALGFLIGLSRRGDSR